MMRNLELERLALAAMSLGIARRCIEVMNKYAKERTAFGSPLSSFGQIQKHIGTAHVVCLTLQRIRMLSSWLAEVTCTMWRVP